MEYDNYNPEQNEIKDINAHEIDIELSLQFPTDTNIENKLYNWFELNVTKKDAIKDLMKLVDRALDKNNKEEFYKLCRIYQNIQVEFKYY